MTAVVPAIYADKVLRRFQFTLVLGIAALVIGVAAAAFFTSFEAIRDYAEHSGGIKPEHAWLVPLLVDSFIAIAQLADLWFTTSGAARRAQGRTKHAIVWSPKVLLALAAGASFALNVAHAEHSRSARAVAAIAPIVLVVSFEILMAVVRWAVAARVERFGAEQPTWREQDVARVIRRAVAAQVPTSEPDRKRAPRVDEQEREAGPTTAPPAPAAKQAAAPARSGVAPKALERATKPERDWSADLKSIERARLFREHATESKRSLIARAREAGVGATSERMSEEIDRIKTEGNGSAPEQSAEVRS